MMVRALLLALSATALTLFSGCGALMGDLRRDFDDSQYEGPTVGGRFAERGFLSESFPESGLGGRYAPTGGRDRAPATESRMTPRESWVNQDHHDMNRRDMYRGLQVDSDIEGIPTQANTPNLPPPTKRAYKSGNRATRSDFLDEAQNEGSLWASDGQTNYYFTKNKIRGVGDIVTVTIEDMLVKDMVSEVRRTLSPKEKEAELIIAQEKINLKAQQAQQQKDSISTTSSAPSGAGKDKKDKEQEADPFTGKSYEARDASLADIDVSAAVEVKAGETMMAEIVERYPNGNYKIRGTKRVNYKNGSPRLISLMGVVKGTDITEEDVIQSGKLYEYRLEAIR